MESTFRTQKFGFSEILGQSIEVIKLGAAQLIPIALLGAIPQAIMLYLIQANTLLDVSDTSYGSLCAMCGLELALFAIIFYAYVAEAYTVEAIVQGRPDGISVALRYALSRLPQVLMVSVLSGIIVMIGIALFIIPGIIVGVYLAFAMPAAALRNVSLQALQYSRSLVKGQWWRVFGILFGIGVLNTVFSYASNWISRILMPSIGIGVILVGTITMIIAFLLSVPGLVFFLNEDYLAHPIQTETVENL